MASCISCGSDVTGKKFCPECGTQVQPTPVANAQVSSTTCPRCGGASRPGAGFCMHCGAALNARATPPPPPPPLTRPCPSCQAQVSADNVFCTNCGHDTRIASAPQIACPSCGRQNAPGVRFCAGCGSQLVPAAPPVQSGYAQPAQYAPQYQQPQYQQQPYQQPQYQQYQQYPQPYNQGGYQPQPMVGQQPMILRCPTCMAMAPLGTPNCLSCRTNLAGVVPTPANVPAGQQGGGFLQGNGGQLAMGALGGAAAVIGGEMLLHGIENSIENRVEGDMGYGERHHHRHNEGLLGGLGELADDIGL